jgi:NADH:ubiquinone oxidoreductase subunit 2 (subunit N)
MLFIIIFYNYCFNSIDDHLVITISLISMLIGSIGVFNTFRLRRLLIYSSLFNLGVSLLFIILESAPAGYAYLFVYSLLSSFLVISFIHFEKFNNYVFNRITDIALIYYGCQVIYFSIIFFALSGIPPFYFF